MRVFIILIFLLPFLLSFQSEGRSYPTYETYLTPKGIEFTSYSSNWDQRKLQELYVELLKNGHGEELTELKAVKIYPDKHQASNTKGSYQALSKTITLYQGDKYVHVEDYRDTLSHEYGHHFAYYYFPSHHFPFSKWSVVRGLEHEAIRWDAFWNYKEEHHANYPQEIFADDYVLLFGSTSEMNSKTFTDHEPFYLRTEHENQNIPNILENKPLIEMIELESGLSVEPSRLIEMPHFTNITDNLVSYQITKKANIAYRLNVHLHDIKNEYGSTVMEFYEITVNDDISELHFNIEQAIEKNDSNYLSFSLDVVDLSTSIGFETEKITVGI
ncbi:hypothetical protein J2S19_001290 [Metabacillus malikii]|uniref:Uncharacterized protein n=2 Tax=Metabacillus malikii TaxID=1504265 RepID=A0ABT9ZCQ3_9BACI|nr:hypothetical protein [Metabacillus malikii]